MTLIQAGHFFAATADYWGDYAWSMHYSFRRCEQSFWARYDDMTLEAARTLRLLLEIDHSGQIGYSSRVLNWLRNYQLALPRWSALMTRAVTEQKVHAKVVMDVQMGGYLDALSVNYTEICVTLPSTDQAECLLSTASIDASTRAHREYFESVYLPACSQYRAEANSGLWSTPSGNEVYQAWLNYHLGYVETAGYINTLGLQRVAENQAGILDTVQLIDPSILTFSSAAASLSNANDTRWFICTDDVNEVLDYVNGLMVLLENNLIPEFADFAGVRVETTVTGSPSTYSETGVFDFSRNFWLQRPHYNVGQKQGCSLDGITLLPYYERVQFSTIAHEAMPGHGMQLQIEAMVACPISEYSSGPTLYYEGWGLYTENLPYNMSKHLGPKGLYEDPVKELSFFQGTMLRNVRLVVDTGMHANLGMGYNECVQFMVIHGPSVV